MAVENTQNSITSSVASPATRLPVDLPVSLVDSVSAVSDLVDNLSQRETDPPTTLPSPTPRPSTSTSSTSIRWERLFKPALGGSYHVFNEHPLPAAIAAYCAGDMRFLPHLRDLYWRRLFVEWREKVAKETERRVRESQSPDYRPNDPDKKFGPWGVGELGEWAFRLDSESVACGDAGGQKVEWDDSWDSSDGTTEDW
ncbi:hypothetical protein VTK56DRAFT_10139 [Thermocarpiscus australiensis]